MGEHLEAMKLVAVALALVAIATAAPRGGLDVESVVPEEAELAQTSTTAGDIEMLKKQFAELQEQIQDGATPGVRGVIEKMIKMVEEDIMKAILDAHNTDQTTLNSKMQKIADLNEMTKGQVEDLHKTRDQIIGMIDECHRKSKDWEAKSKQFTSDQNAYLKVHEQMRGTCCDKDHAGIIEVEYTPAYATCNYQTPEGANCASKAVKAVDDIVRQPFTHGLSEWRRLLGECNGLIADTDKANTKTENAIRAGQLAKKLTKDDEKLTQGAKDTWSSDWDTTISTYDSTYDTYLKDYNENKKRVTSNMADRKKEHEAVHEINCLLKAYRDGGSFEHDGSCTKSEAADSKSRYNIKFPRVVNISHGRSMFTGNSLMHQLTRTPATHALQRPFIIVPCQPRTMSTPTAPQERGPMRLAHTTQSHDREQLCKRRLQL